MNRSHALTICALLIVAACGGAADGQADATSTTSAPSTTEPGAATTTTGDITSTTTTLPSNVPTATVLAAIDDLANRLDVETREIRLIESEEVTWDDESLGCPDPDVSYEPNPQQGYRMVLNYGERGYDYHAGADGAPFLCPTDEKDGGYDFMPPPGFDT